MSQDASTLYKLIILYMLEQAGMPLTNAQISDFILEMEYTNYFTIQTTIKSLEENRFITLETIRDRTTKITITPEGSEVLGYCIEDISDAIKQDVKRYLDKNYAEIVEETQVVADYFESNKDEFTARCLVRDGNSTVVEINLNVASEEEARTICSKWKDKSQEIYGYLIHQLLAD